VSDARRGLAVVSTGLLESCARDHAERPLALMLFRATRHTVFTDGEPESQLQGELNFDYWLVPFRSAADRARLCDLGVRLAAGLRDVQMSAADVAIYQSSASLPPRSSFLTLTGDVVMTSTREVGATLEVRLFNPQTKPAAATLDFRGRPRGAACPHLAQRVDFESQPQGKPTPFTNTFKLTLKPKEIVTLRLT
jgi:alpha-mannosidase/mannosylglycerate hydrolase